MAARIPTMPHPDFVPIEESNGSPGAPIGPAMMFDHYEFNPETDRLGEGPLSEVYRAVDKRLGRTVALKILRAHAEIDPQADERFRREASHTSKLDHPNIVTIYDYSQFRGTSYIVMEYVQGRTLDKVIKDQTLGYEECLRIALQITAALKFVHEQGIIHRDLKPGNVLLRDDGTIKLLDFGIARARDEAGITQHGMLVGTVLYMSPEQVRGEDLDFRSDVFALGAVLYNVMTGQLPFPGQSFPEVCMAVLDAKPRPPSKVRQGFPKPIEEVINKCLAADPGDRYSNAAGVHDALVLIQSELSGTNSHTATSLQGAIAILPLQCGGEDPASCHIMAGGVRKDLASELARNKGLEVRLVDELVPGTGDKCDWLLRGELSVEGTRGVLDLELEVGDLKGRRGMPAKVYRDRCEYEDDDEWSLQANLVRSAVRTVRRRILEAAVRPSDEVRRKVDEAVALCRHAYDVMHRGSTKHLLAAISTLRRGLDMDRFCALAYAGLSEAMVRKFLYWDGEETFLDEARDAASRALALDPACAEAHTSLGLACHLSGHTSDAQREYRLAIQKNNKEWFAHRLLGAVLSREGNFKHASPLLQRATELKPEHTATYDHLYNVLQRLDRYEEALEVADKGIATAHKHLTKVPDDQDARLHMAMLQARIGLHDEARAQVEEARRRAPKDGFTAFHSASVFVLMGELDAAIDALVLAQERGYYVKSELHRNRDFDVLRGMKRFEDLS